MSIMVNVEKEFGLKEVKTLAEELLPLINDARIITFSGPLGAGKTTLVREIAKQLGIKKRVTSPTFTYLATYKTADETQLYHFDLYRLKSRDSFYEAGFEEYLYLPKTKVFIEWPEIIENVLPVERLQIKLDYVEGDSKKRFIQTS